jgi:hypothetical protein
MPDETAQKYPPLWTGQYSPEELNALILSLLSSSQTATEKLVPGKMDLNRGILDWWGVNPYPELRDTQVGPLTLDQWIRLVPQVATISTPVGTYVNGQSPQGFIQAPTGTPKPSLGNNPQFIDELKQTLSESILRQRTR